MRTIAAAILAVLVWVNPARADRPAAELMVELTLGGRRIEGMPLAWDSQWVHLLGRDGQLWEFDPKEASDFRKTSDRFRGYSISRLRATLLRELGQGFEVSGTGHYLVAHPSGKRSQWARRFEDLYRSLVHYFSVRGFSPQEPAFPLIGIVCKNRQDFFRYAAVAGAAASPGLLGYYSPRTNRIVLYDVGSGHADASQWQQNAATVIHEATHQTAFNTGIHSRYTATPVWVVEGLATLFEAPGVYNSRVYTQQSDRINRDRLRQFKALVVPRHRPEVLSGMIASDRLFRTNPAAAYAEAWALTFYLVETQAGKYTEYLVCTARRPPFRQYTAAERTADFTAVFGDDFRMLQARFLRFMAKVE